MRRLAIISEALAATLTLAVAALAWLSVRPDRAVGGALVGVALAWSAVPLLVEMTAGRNRGDGGRSAHGSIGTVTTVIRLGDEPLEVARTSISLAVQAGPVALVSTAQDIPEPLRDLGVPIHVDPTIEGAVAAAAAEARTWAVLVISARAMPCADECRAAAGRLGGRVGWAVGSVRVFNDDGYAPDGREVIGARLRSRARARGLDLWETDATIVRTDVLRDHPIRPGRPWGRWLRDLRAAGLEGVEHRGALALRAAPADAAAYWPDTTARQRGSAADLADAIGSGRPAARLLAAALLSRELFALPMLIWLLTPAMIGSNGEFPFAIGALPSLAILTGLAVARWMSLRFALGVELHPVADATSALHHLPGSLAATGAAITRRVRAPRLSLPARPLAWAALILTVLVGSALFGRPSAEPVSQLTIGLSVALLGALWMFSMQAFMQRNWARSTFRLPLDLDATVDGVPAHTSDGSPTGLALVGRFDGVEGGRGSRVEVTVRLDDGEAMRSCAGIASRRDRTDDELLGLSLELDDSERDAWLAQLFRAARSETVAHRLARTERAPLPSDEPLGRRNGIGRWFDRAVEALVVAVSVAVVTSLMLVMFGYRPFVIRSGSMVPTIDVGDVVITDLVPASTIRPGDIVTRLESPEFGESLTHRVVSVSPTDRGLRVTTQGDANSSSESWTVPPDTAVGRKAFIVPWIGAPAILVRTSTAKLLAGLAALALVLAAVLRSWLTQAPGIRRAWG